MPILIFRYIFTEIVPQFFSSLFVFCAIIVISQMIRLSEFLLAFGLSFENLVLPIIFIVTPFLTFTIPISLMFALMLSFMRLSSDGEYAAMLASGMGLKRILYPVGVVTFVLLLSAIYSGTYLESWGRREYLAFTFKKTQNELDNLIRSKMQSGVFLEDFLGYTFFAEKIDPEKENYKNVFISPKKHSFGSGISAVTAPSALIKGSVEEESLKMTLFNGISYAVDKNNVSTSISTFDRLDVDLLRLFREQIFGNQNQGEDYRSFSTPQLYNYLNSLKEIGDTDSKKYYKPAFLFHTRIASGFGTIIFAIFGLVLGINDPRRGKAAAYTFAIFTVIASYVFTTSFKGVAEAGQVSAAFAVWFPFAVQLFFGFFLLYQKNRLPPSEAVLAPRNLPFLKKL